MAKDAIRWWISLEENVQRSWKLVRKEMLSAYPPMFHGKRGEEAEEFVRMIHRRTGDARRQGDAKWINELVQRCLAGEALRWYATLESKVRDNWKLLRRAMMARWPTRDEKEIATLKSSSAGAPIPNWPTTTRSDQDYEAV
ncbi:hypothetical protein FRC00_005838 [Tulasnella sp. 408]|nr:hypothetical protein FRC00_005838 [Tulasnella sp. 408]